MGGPVSEEQLSSLLRHSTQLRSRNTNGRFGLWESRTAPAAGGLHALRIVALTGDGSARSGLYDDLSHGLRAPSDMADALCLNRENLVRLLGTSTGTTLQFVADGALYAACYENWSSLMWRDSGALCTILTLVATALSLNSVVLGHHGDNVVAAFGMSPEWIAAGAVHIGG